MKITTKLTLSALAIMALGSHATAASFNCHKAATKIEHAICEDKWLSELDGEMGKLYHKAKAYQHDLPQYQKMWIKNRNAECGANTDCLYKWTENRVTNFKNIIKDAKSGKTVNAPKKKHAKGGAVYFPEHGILCDKKAGFCADSEGISMGYTKEYLGQAAQDKMMGYMNRDHMDTSSYTLSNGIHCDSHKKKCFEDRYNGSPVNKHYTNKLFR
jgi:uncharacterized protein